MITVGQLDVMNIDPDHNESGLRHFKSSHLKMHYHEIILDSTL
jgi:hypothetical protein